MEDNLLYLKVKIRTKNKEDHKVVSETGFIFTRKKYFHPIKEVGVSCSHKCAVFLKSQETVSPQPDNKNFVFGNAFLQNLFPYI